MDWNLDGIEFVCRYLRSFEAQCTILSWILSRSKFPFVKSSLAMFDAIFGTNFGAISLFFSTFPLPPLQLFCVKYKCSRASLTSIHDFSQSYKNLIHILKSRLDVILFRKGIIRLSFKVICISQVL